MKNQPEVLQVTDFDYEKLSSYFATTNSPLAQQLEEELARATIVPQKEITRDVVTMNSKVKFIDEETQKESEVTLVYPPEANIDDNKISVLAPVGAALIGLKEGQSIHWPLPSGGKKKIKVLKVIYQPEAEGRFDL